MRYNAIQQARRPGDVFLPNFSRPGLISESRGIAAKRGRGGDIDMGAQRIVVTHC